MGSNWGATQAKTLWFGAQGDRQRSSVREAMAPSNELPSLCLYVSTELAIYVRVSGGHGKLTFCRGAAVFSLQTIVAAREARGWGEKSILQPWQKANLTYVALEAAEHWVFAPERPRTTWVGELHLSWVLVDYIESQLGCQLALSEASSHVSLHSQLGSFFLPRPLKDSNTFPGDSSG